jgi:hypothetical protein
MRRHYRFRKIYLNSQDVASRLEDSQKFLFCSWEVTNRCRPEIFNHFSRLNWAKGKLVPCTTNLRAAILSFPSSRNFYPTLLIFLGSRWLVKILPRAWSLLTSNRWNHHWCSRKNCLKLSLLRIQSSLLSSRKKLFLFAHPGPLES